MSIDDLIAARPDGTMRDWRHGRPDKLLEQLATDPYLGNALCGIGDVLLGGDKRVTELIALRVAVVRDCEYIWNGHTWIASDPEGAALSEDVIDAIRTGPDALGGRDALVVSAVDELLADGLLSRARRERLREQALTVTVGTMFYAIIAALMVGAEPDAKPVAGLALHREDARFGRP